MGQFIDSNWKIMHKGVQKWQSEVPSNMPSMVMWATRESSLRIPT